jgi:hypothetical protein
MSSGSVSCCINRMNFGQVMQIVYFVYKNIVYYAFIVFRCILLYEFSLSFTLKKIIDYFLINYQTTCNLN